MTDRAESVSELERVALLLETTANAIEIEDPTYSVAVAPMHKAAAELRLAVENLRAVWEVP